MLQHAQTLVYSLIRLMPSDYQKASLQTLLGRFLSAQGEALPAHTPLKSASALSRFLNHYQWSTRQGAYLTDRGWLSFGNDDIWEEGVKAFINPGNPQNE
jgi:hypothetical protein